MVNSSTSGNERSDNQMYLVDLRDIVRGADSLEAALDETTGVWDGIYERMSPEETLWVLAANEYRGGRCWPAPMAFADHIREQTDFDLKNTITVHRFDEERSEGSALDPTYVELLLLVRDQREYQFYKDRIRIDHIYKGNEWGDDRETGRSSYHDTEVSRYNEDGRDPGNVWLTELRNETADQSVDSTAPIELVEAIERCILVGSDDGESVYVYGFDAEIDDAMHGVDRTLERFDLEDGVVV